LAHAGASTKIRSACSAASQGTDVYGAPGDSAGPQVRVNRPRATAAKALRGHERRGIASTPVVRDGDQRYARCFDVRDSASTTETPGITSICSPSAREMSGLLSPTAPKMSTTSSDTTGFEMICRMAWSSSSSVLRSPGAPSRAPRAAPGRSRRRPPRGGDDRERGFMLTTVQPHYLPRTGRVKVPMRGDFPFAPLA